MKDKINTPPIDQTSQPERSVTNAPKVRKVVIKKDDVKRYRVTVRYVPVSEEEAKIKRAIIEGIMRKPYKKK